MKSETIQDLFEVIESLSRVHNALNYPTGDLKIVEIDVRGLQEEIVNAENLLLKAIPDNWEEIVSEHEGRAPMAYTSQ